MRERVLVTGGDGFLGSHVVRELVESGLNVRVLSEPGRNLGSFDASVEVVRGDIRVSSEVDAAANGCDYLIHAAACTDVWPVRSPKLEAINITGTKHVIEAVLHNRVGRLIHVGTANSFRPGSMEAPGTEEVGFHGERYGLGYIETKRAAQGLVTEAIKSRGLPAVIVAPTFMIGPNDSKPGAGALVIAIAERKIPGFTPGGRNYVFVGDVAKGIVSALTKGRIGEAYILGNTNLTYRELFRLVGEVWGVRTPSIAMPVFAVRLSGFIGSLSGHLLRSAPKVSRELARISLDSHYYSPAKAIRELGLPQTPIAEAIREALQWFAAHGYLSAKLTARHSHS